MSGWPWQRRINPYYQEVKSESEEWFRTFKVSNSKGPIEFEQGGFCLLAALTFPAISKEHLRTACDWMMLVFTLDDCTDFQSASKVREYADAAMDAIYNPFKLRPQGKHVVGEIARQFWQRAIRTATPLSQVHLIQAFEDYIGAVVDEAADRDDNCQKGTDEYLALRRRTIAVLPSYTMLELGMDLVDEVWKYPVIHRLRSIGVDMVLLDNDICSYQKEFLAGDNGHNIITIIMRQLDTDVQGAMDFVVKMRSNLENEFIALYSQLPSFGERLDPQVRAYVEGLARSPRANDCWMFEVERYFGSESKAIRRDRVVNLMKSPRSIIGTEEGRAPQASDFYARLHS